MFALAILIGIYSYVIFALGIVGLLYKFPVIIATVIFILGALVYFRKHKEDLPRFQVRKRKFTPLLILFGAFAFVNLIGVFGPELSFDALWYHLTIPKIFIQNHKIFFIEGNLFYYSLMPKLGEMLYIPSLMFINETLPKLIQWSFGILTSIVVYKISRKYFTETVSFFAVLIFYGSLVVAWESTTAYIDLIRTFFEVMGLLGFINWYETKDRKWLVESAVMIGFAMSTKNLAIGSLVIFFVLFFLSDKDFKLKIKNGLIFASVAFFTALPWYIYSFLFSGNPVYPFFDKRIAYDTALNLNPILFPREAFDFFLKLADPISPLYLIFIPLVVIYFKKFNKPLKLIAIYSLVAIIIWYITPRTGGGRFILPYLPAFSVIAIAAVNELREKRVRNFSFALIIFVFILNMIYRGIANVKYFPVIMGLEKKEEFLTKNLNFNFGDFYDTDGYFERNIRKDDRVLLYGFHNLYYAEFPFIDSTYVKRGDGFNFVATQNADLPKRFKNWKLIYRNDLTKVKVYTLEGIMWHY